MVGGQQEGAFLTQPFGVADDYFPEKNSDGDSGH
jgi:hypothetical protein